MAASAPTASEGKKTDLPKPPPPASVSGSADKDGTAPSMDFPEKWARSIGILGLLPKTKDGKIDPFLSLKLTGNRTDKNTIHEWYGTARVVIFKCRYGGARHQSLYQLPVSVDKPMTIDTPVSL